MTMTMKADISASRRRGGWKIAAAVGATTLLLAAMALDTKVVVLGSEEDLREQAFSPEHYGAETFPTVRDSIRDRAVDAAELAEAVLADRTAAAETYGVGSGTGAVIPVRFTGTMGEAKSGIYTVAVPDVPEEITVRVQTGPAINGTELRDATGDIEFGQFKNQIEYQNAGAALNDAMKAEVLSGIDTASLSGREVAIVGAFRLINPKNWLITPVELEAQ
ncbi:DUF2291 family protein [Limimaricola cinnabarinus]|uniref:Predicted erythritol ABC transporter 2, hypothetical lipoprotein n=1 Tax=Limimaricola cinnabarinus LL-001 TaxID=1337093 RepID=U2Z5N8_9RHOB|nr:DUF2291 domain-containing protein [Limimaricola cinnabarinus]GAD56735.1 predicted erythritol ABC transporter 2, hypothetical lipoprotein [Limimaricola cinnabarinus LL-001]